MMLHQFIKTLFVVAAMPGRKDTEGAVRALMIQSRGKMDCDSS